MSKGMGDLGRKLREMMPEYFAFTDPFEGRVYKLTKTRYPIVKAPNSDDVVINDYNGLEEPHIGSRVKVRVTNDGKGVRYSSGQLLELYPTNEERIKSLKERLLYERYPPDE